MAHEHCMLGTKGYKHTLRIRNTYCFFTVTVVARTRLNVTLYVHCLSFLFRSHRNKIRCVTYDKKKDGRGVCGKCEREAMYVQGTGGEI
jgi:hypothetical protein